MLALLIDIGSTYTKLVVVDLEGEAVIDRVEALTTVDSDVTLGIKCALKQLKSRWNLDSSQFKIKLACSSAAGGLKLAAVGLVPELTAEAAKRAALSAGAKVIGVYSYKLSRVEVEKLYQSSPDIILLAGGTDGGDEETILHNAFVIADSALDCPIIIAGNKCAASKVSETLNANRKKTIVVENVLPDLDKLDIEPTREAIRRTFIERIIYAKGLSKVSAFVEALPLPTPSSVLAAVELLADGTAIEPGLGELVMADVGGATTDIHSVASESPPESESYPLKIIKRGLPEPRVKRTVEGDLGLRINALSILNSIGVESLSEKLKIKAEKAEVELIKEYLYQVSKNVGQNPKNQLESLIDATLAASAIEIALSRHAGRFEALNTPSGNFLIQSGKNLSKVKYLIASGGVFAHNNYADKLLSQSLNPNQTNADPDPFSLKPKDAKLLIDRKYLIWAMGLLGMVEPNVALRIMKRELME
jgi:uncharacterized protein (TIGR01319 family)